MLKYTHAASVLDCAYCSNQFGDNNSVIVRSLDRKLHKSRLGVGGAFKFVIMKDNSLHEPLTLKDGHAICQCADCHAHIPVESTEHDPNKKYVKLVEMPDGQSSRDAFLTEGFIYELLGRDGSNVIISSDLTSFTSTIWHGRVQPVEKS